MKMQLERHTVNGERVVILSANDEARKAETLRQWIKMLRLAEQWLCEKEPAELRSDAGRGPAQLLPPKRH